ncbi:hypothetical protein LCGC14_2871470 [marine sediment metagenome]|uniref:Uncharacterized protein n=1 Tax=marine sediment metagenome TaxID=412755 RepID=A0A0F9ATZ3_9ZZZZ
MARTCDKCGICLPKINPGNLCIACRIKRDRKHARTMKTPHRGRAVRFRNIGDWLE